MGKTSGWDTWRSQYNKYSRAKDRGSAGNTVSELGAFAESSPGPVAKQLFETESITYADNGSIVIQPDKVKEAAARLAKEARYIKGRNADEIVQSIRGANQRLSEKQAINRAKKQAAASATAILTAARIGKVRLTPAQRSRLEQIRNGGYIKASDLSPRKQRTGRGYNSENTLYKYARYEYQREQLRESRRPAMAA
jgi:hypothetical protein